MAPTICNNDIVITRNSLSSPKIFKLSFQKGDVVIFDTKSGKENLIKRIIASAGDTISIFNNELLINDKSEKFFPKYSNLNIKFDDWHYSHLIDSLNSFEYLKDNKQIGPVIVKQNSYFLLGDNLSNSFDSRRLGFINEANIKSRVLFYFSFPLFKQLECKKVR